MWTCSNLVEAGVKVPAEERLRRVWLVTLEALHLRQVRIPSLTSLFMPVYMNRDIISCCDARMPGCEMSWSCRNIAYRCCTGR